MLIANPLYDSVFKYMMEDIDVAMGFISTIINEPIVHLEFKPQENYTDIDGKLARYSLDFIATIKQDDGQFKDVLIELQKSSSSSDLLRFRRYLGNQYRKPANLPQSGEKPQKTAIPIITIYILGYNLSESLPPVIKVNRNYIDLIEGKEIHEKNDFIECLTHDSYIIQVPKLHFKMQSRLDYILSVFKQENFYEEDKRLINYDYDINNNDEIYKKIVRQLGKAAANAELMHQLETDELVYIAFGSKLEKMEKDLAKKDKVIEEKDKALEEKDKALKDKDKALEEKNRALEEKDKRLQALMKQFGIK